MILNLFFISLKKRVGGSKTANKQTAVLLRSFLLLRSQAEILGTVRVFAPVLSGFHGLVPPLLFLSMSGGYISLALTEHQRMPL